MTNDVTVNQQKDGPLSEDELRAWSLLVSEGRLIREPIIRKQEERRKKSIEKCGSKMFSKSSRDSLVEVAPWVKRWVIFRFAGISFRKSFEVSGATWIEVQEAKAHNEEFRCAIAAMEENSRQLMRAKAQSIIEQSQEEDAKVSLAQTQISMRILESLDRDHFGERSNEKDDEEEDDNKKSIGDGGFVINLIGDAASVCAKPIKNPGRALVFNEV